MGLAGPLLVARGGCLAVVVETPWLSAQSSLRGVFPWRRSRSHLVAAADPFPRMLPLSKTVRAVLRSETGCIAQETLEKTLQSPPELTISADVAWCDSSNRYVLGGSLFWVLVHQCCPLQRGVAQIPSARVLLALERSGMFQSSPMKYLCWQRQVLPLSAPKR